MNIKKLRLWIFGSLVFAYSVGLGFFRVLPAYYLNFEGVACQGTILRIRPEEPNAFDYCYVVNGVVYKNAGAMSGLPGEQVGSKITVHYNPQQPGTSCVGDTAKRFEDETVPAVLGSIIIPLALSFLIPTTFGFN